MQETLLKNELRNIKKNEANAKSGYTTDLLNPDKLPPAHSNPRETPLAGYGLKKSEGIFGSSGRIAFDSQGGLSTNNVGPNFKKGQSAQVLPPNYGLKNPQTSSSDQSRGFLGMKLHR